LKRYTTVGAIEQFTL